MTDTRLNIDTDGTFRTTSGNMCIVSIGTWIACRNGRKGYVRNIDYTRRVAWVSDGDGSQAVGFHDILVPE